MPRPDLSPGRLPSEWLEAIHGAKTRPIPQRPEPVVPAVRAKDENAHPYDHSAELQSLIGRLKRERIRKGLSLGDVARLTEQARSALSRLESGEYSNPTFHTVYRYARALGWDVKLSARPFVRKPGADEAP